MSVLDETFVPSETDIANAKEFSRAVARDIDPTSVITIQSTGDGRSIEVPKNVFDVLVKTLAIMAEGKAFSLIPVDKELTTQQAADILNVSRPFLSKVLDLGEIPHRKVGRNRRVKFRDLIEYKKNQEQSSKAALQSLADEAQELGMGY
ncbi:helix-turn-helix domain-containing protein [Rosistilla oblonga]|uniref:helix-turn-helix domain-containing protein n=1 Tax=Rosistilla oblonga TaxID=2527990 RepID=UPI003A97F653